MRYNILDVYVCEYVNQKPNITKMILTSKRLNYNVFVYFQKEFLLR